MSQNTRTTVEELFGAAQREVEQAWERCVKSVHACERDAIAARFGEFATRLRRQIKLEEEILFPAISREAHALENDPVVLMRAEHRQIEELLELLEAKVAARDCAALYGQHVGPSALFRTHLSGEQNVLYPLADLLIPAHKRAEIVDAARSAGCGA